MANNKRNIVPNSINFNNIYIVYGITELLFKNNRKLPFLLPRNVYGWLYDRETTFSIIMHYYTS